MRRFQNTSTTFKKKMLTAPRKQQWYIKYVYLNNLMNICFINYFLYINLKELRFLFQITLIL